MLLSLVCTCSLQILHISCGRKNHISTCGRNSCTFAQPKQQIQIARIDTQRDVFFPWRNHCFDGKYHEQVGCWWFIWMCMCLKMLNSQLPIKKICDIGRLFILILSARSKKLHGVPRIIHTPTCSGWAVWTCNFSLEMLSFEIFPQGKAVQFSLASYRMLGFHWWWELESQMKLLFYCLALTGWHSLYKLSDIQEFYIRISPLVAWGSSQLDNWPVARRNHMGGLSILRTYIYCVPAHWRKKRNVTFFRKSSIPIKHCSSPGLKESAVFSLHSWGSGSL